jgi:hypothetical protein
MREESRLSDEGQRKSPADFSTGLLTRFDADRLAQ